MFALIGRFYGTWDEGLYQVEDGSMQILLGFEEGRAIEEDACGGPIFFSEGAAHEARLRFRGHRLDWSGARFELARVVELDTSKIRALVEHGDERATADEYRQAYTEAIRLGEEWHERDPRRGELLPEFRA